MTTPTHMIQFNFVDVLSNAEGKTGFCPSNLMILDRRDPKGTVLKVEEGTFTCAEYDRTTLFDLEKPPRLVGNSGNLQMSITKVRGTTYKVSLLEKTKLDLELDMEFDYSTAPSHVYTTPLNKDKTAYFATLKKPGLKMTGSFKTKGSTYQCDAKKGKPCHMIIDVGRTTQAYGIQYFWSLLMTQLPDGRTLSFNLGDGMGSGYRGLDQASEDFITIDMEYYKLDVTRMEGIKHDAKT